MSFNHLKLGLILSIFVSLLWSNYYTINDGIRQGLVFETGGIVYVLTWLISLFGLLPILINELLSKKKILTLFNIFFLSSLIVFDLNYLFNYNQLWVFD